MKNEYLIVLDYCSGRIIKIKLTDEEKDMAERISLDELVNYKDFYTRYGFRPIDCTWMSCKELDEVEYNF